MKTIAIYIAIIIASISLFSACATILTGTKQKVSLVTFPAGARVYVNGVDKNVVTPCEIRVSRKSEITYAFRKEGYEDGVVSQWGTFNPTVLVNILIGGILGGVIDYATGAWYEIPENVMYSFDASVPFRPQAESSSAHVNAGAIADCDNPSGIVLGRPLIRWNFDSNPTDAHIFWRVISSIPDQVENTNEAFLTTTPCEAIRPLRISGLTYDNSCDVTIEVKVTKDGYYDQVKYYKLRQVIDQQEINGFFEMVSVEE